MKLTEQQLKEMGYVEKAHGNWEKIERMVKRAQQGLPMIEPPPSKPPKRIRQSSKPLMNKLESEFFDNLRANSMGGLYKVIPQAITFRLANGLRYTPDVFSFAWPWKTILSTVAWEVKGKWFTDDAKAKIKMFAAVYPSIVVLLASKDEVSGQWILQEVFA